MIWAAIAVVATLVAIFAWWSAVAAFHRAERLLDEAKANVEDGRRILDAIAKARQRA